jgi:hypothetical protein
MGIKEVGNEVIRKRGNFLFSRAAIRISNRTLGSWSSPARQKFICFESVYLNENCRMLS